MSEMTHMTPAQIRSEVAGMTQILAELVELLGLYGECYADGISEEISALLGRIGARAHVLRRQHIAAHARDAAFADSVSSDLDRLEVADAEPEPFGWAPEAHDLVFPVNEEGEK